MVVVCLFAQAAFVQPASGFTLEEAISLALTRNERARSAVEEARAADARVGRARAFLFPSLTATGAYSYRPELERGNTDRETTEGTIVAEQTILDFRSFPLLGQARHLRAAARLTAEDARRLLAFDTAEAFLTVLNAQQVARAAEERLEFAERNLREIRVRFDAELVGSNDVTRAELEVASAERELVRARGALRVSHLGLENLTATDIDDTLAVPAELLAEAERPVAALAAEMPPAATNRPDLLAERARVAALRSSAREPLGRYFPALGASAVGRSAEDDGASGRDENWTIGLGLTWNLFDGGIRESERAERRALARAAELDLSNLERAVAFEVETAQVRIESDQASLARAEVAVQAARRNAAETAELYRQGLARALEVVDANVQVFEAEVERAAAQYSLVLALLGLRSSAGLDPLPAEVSR